MFWEKSNILCFRLLSINYVGFNFTITKKIAYLED